MEFFNRSVSYTCNDFHKDNTLLDIRDYLRKKCNNKYSTMWFDPIYFLSREKDECGCPSCELFSELGVEAYRKLQLPKEKYKYLRERYDAAMKRRKEWRKAHDGTLEGYRPEFENETDLWYHVSHASIELSKRRNIKPVRIIFHAYSKKIVNKKTSEVDFIHRIVSFSEVSKFKRLEA